MLSKFSSVQSLSHVRPHGLQHPRLPCPSPAPAACSNSCPSSWWCHPTISSSVIFFFSCLPSFPASGSSNESVLHIRWPKHWSFSFSINPSNEYSGLISFRIDWFDLLAVQGTLKSLLQHHNLKASSLHGPTLKSIHDYWKNHSSDYMDVCRQKWCLCFLICCLGLSEWTSVLISRLQSPSAVILEPKKIKSVTASIFFPLLFAMKWWP